MQRPVTTISIDQPVVTLVNVFHVHAAQQAELIDLLRRTTEETMSRFPGFVSANFHASLDGTRVLNYAQWRSRADFEAMLADPGARALRDSARVLARDDPMMYDVVSVHHAP
jgi:quinol monooxygenase YgiN